MNRLIFQLAAAFAAPLIAGAAAATIALDGPAQDLAGRYTRAHEVGMVRGEPFQAEDVVEIAPVSAEAAYVSLQLNFFNGHMCELSGVARAEGEALLYTEPAWDDPEMPRCQLRIDRRGDSLHLGDGGGSCRVYCGARGSLHEADLPWASRVRIDDLDRLRESDAYRWALEEWRTGRRVHP